MIPDLQSSLLCDDVRQERNGKFILIGLFDALNLPSLPFRVPRLFTVTRWCSGSGEFMQRTRVIRPDQSTALLEGKPLRIKLNGPESTVTNIEGYLNIAFHEAGTHWVEILLDDTLKLRYPLRVHQVAPRSPGQQA